MVIRVGRYSTKLADSLQYSDVYVDRWDFGGDYYALPNLVPMLARPTRLDLLLEVMDVELPARADPAS